MSPQSVTPISTPVARGSGNEARRTHREARSFGGALHRGRANSAKKLGEGMPAGELVVAVEKERLQDQFDPDVAEVTRRVEQRGPPSKRRRADAR